MDYIRTCIVFCTLFSHSWIFWALLGHPFLHVVLVGWYSRPPFWSYRTLSTYNIWTFLIILGILPLLTNPFLVLVSTHNHPIYALLIFVGTQNYFVHTFLVLLSAYNHKVHILFVHFSIKTTLFRHS